MHFGLVGYFYWVRNNAKDKNLETIILSKGTQGWLAFKRGKQNEIDGIISCYIFSVIQTLFSVSSCFPFLRRFPQIQAFITWGPGEPSLPSLPFFPPSPWIWNNKFFYDCNDQKNVNNIPKSTPRGEYLLTDIDTSLWTTPKQQYYIVRIVNFTQSKGEIVRYSYP